MATWIKTDGGRTSCIDDLPPTSVYNDCLCRSLALATNTHYVYIWAALTIAKRENPVKGCKGNAFHRSSISQARIALERMGVSILRNHLTNRRKLTSWIDEHPTFTGIVRTGNHFVAVSRGHYYDEVDTGNKQVTDFYELRSI